MAIGFTGLIIEISVLIQLATVFLALRLIKITGNRISWGLISLSIFFMAVRRSISLFWFISGDQSYHPDLTFELVGLITSVIMIAGVLLITPLFKSMSHEIMERRRAEDALRKNEKKLSSITSNLAEGIYVFNKNGRVIFMNPEAERLLGWTIDEVNEKGPHNLVHYQKADGKPLSFDECDIHRVIKTGKRFCSTDEVFVRKDGTVFPISVITSPIIEDGNIIASVTAFRDITELKRTEEELRKHREHLEEIVEKRTAEAVQAAHLASIGELAAGVAHEINNPINGIINYAQMLANKLDKDEAGRDIAGRIIKEGDRIAEIVKSLLSFARVKEDKKKNVHIDEILSESLVLTALQIQKDGIILKKQIPSGMPSITANFQQMQQVFLNILSNARYALNQKYPFAHEDKILEITVQKVMMDNIPYVRVTFLDHGSGIPSDMHDKVMRPFFSTKPDDTGTGLGLSISYNIVRDHGGKLMLKSREGEFTAVTIDLPASGEM